MNKREATIIGTYTGIVLTNFGDIHEYCEELLGRPIETAEFANKEFADMLKVACRKDFESVEIEGRTIGDRIQEYRKKRQQV